MKKKIQATCSTDRVFTHVCNTDLDWPFCLQDWWNLTTYLDPSVANPITWAQVVLLKWSLITLISYSTQKDMYIAPLSRWALLVGEKTPTWFFDHPHLSPMHHQWLVFDILVKNCQGFQSQAEPRYVEKLPHMNCYCYLEIDTVTSTSPNNSFLDSAHMPAINLEQCE